MKTIQINLPPELSSELERLGLTENPGLVAWVQDAIEQKLSAARQLEYLQSRAARGQRELFLQTLSKIQSTEPAAEDRW